MMPLSVNLNSGRRSCSLTVDYLLWYQYRNWAKTSHAVASACRARSMGSRQVGFRRLTRDADVILLRHGGPASDFVCDETAEHFRWAAIDDDSLLVEFRRDVGLVDDAVDFAVEAGDDCGRRSGGREDADPGDRFEAEIARFAECRQVWKVSVALQAADC